MRLLTGPAVTFVMGGRTGVLRIVLIVLASLLIQSQTAPYSKELAHATQVTTNDTLRRLQAGATALPAGLWFRIDANDAASYPGTLPQRLQSASTHELVCMDHTAEEPVGLRC